jgi:hypothetical protein
MTTGIALNEIVVGVKSYALDDGAGEVTSTVFAPVKQDDGYICKVAIRWPDWTETDLCRGYDCLNALMVAIDRAHRLVTARIQAGMDIRLAQPGW